MAIIKSFSPLQNLSNFNVFLEDTDPNSEYFRITEFQETFTGGKNGFLIEGSEFLKPTTEVKLELLDVEGNPIFFIPGEGIPEYYEGVSKLVSVHVYEDTPIGQGKITILGELERYIDEQGIEREVPDEWKGVYNVKWERTFRVNKNLNNETIVRFVKRPQVQVEEIVKPFFTKEIPQITQTGSASGIGENPPEGTNLTGYTAGTLYRLAITDDSNFTSSVDENIITFTDLGYSSTVREVLNNKEVLVDVPYTENNVVTNFQNQSYTTTFEDLESQSTVESALTGSFAKIKLNRLKTFVGDVARVKVFRKSRNEVGDFQLVQDARIESTELLRDITVQDDTEVFYGNFTQNILDTYWVSGSNDHPISLDDTKLFGGIQVDYNEGIGGTQTLITSESFQIEDDVEYNLSFKTLFDGTINSSKTLTAFLTSSYSSSYEGEDILVQVRQDFVSRSAEPSFNNRVNISENLVSTFSGSARLGFEFVGADWYVSKVSLKNAQETSFSPDELTLIQDVPRRLPQETFDFRFEFYDVNNNFIPVSVTATKEFVGGNDFRTEQKLFTFESDRTAFRYVTGSVRNPENQQIQFRTTQQNLTGSITYASQAFDLTGSELDANEWIQYPGLLTQVTPAGALLTIDNFEGIYDTASYGDRPYVGSIIYTASIEDRQEFETIFRFEDGEDAPALIVTSNTNQFIYEPTQLRPKPLGQEVRIKAQRKNLGSLFRDIEIYASGSLGKDKLYGTGSFTTLGYPDISGSVTEILGTGVSTYTLSAIQFSQSFAGEDGPYGDITYEFSSSDEFDNTFSDEITVSPVINFDGLSVVLSNEMTSFRANSQGLVLDDFESGDGEVEVRIGENVIQHSDGLVTRNRFDIISASETNVTAIDTTPNTNEYGIIQLNGDSGSLVLDIKYLAGDNATSQSFTKKVNYTKNRISPPAILLDVENRVQNKSAKSTGEQLEAFDNSTVTVQQIYTGSVSGLTSPSLSILSDPNSVVSSTTTDTITFTSLPDGVDSSIVSFEVSGTDSEGATRTLQDSISLSKSTKGVPAVEFQVTPNAQTVESNSVGGDIGTAQNLTVTVREGSNTRALTSLNSSATNEVDTSDDENTGIITLDVSGMSADTSTVTISASTTDSEGTAVSTTLTATITKSKSAPPNVLVSINPQTQAIQSGSLIYQSPDPIVVSVKEGTTSYSVGSGDETFTIGSITGPFTTSTNQITTTLTEVSESISGTAVISYTNSEGSNDSEDVSFSIGVVREGNDGATGSIGVTGPGVVHTGVWEVGRIYQFDDGLLTGTGRRDTVLWSENGEAPYEIYYAATTAHTSSDDNSPSTGRPDLGGPWLSLGTEDFFVAAKIGIFEDSFIQNTLNIGSNQNGKLSSANITLFGGSDENGPSQQPYISIDQANTLDAQGYEQDGIFLGMDGADGKFSIVGDDGALRWNGTDLIVSGAINASSGNISGDLDVSGSLQIGGLVRIGDSVSPRSLNIQTGTITFNVTDSVTDGSGVSFSTGSFGNETTDVVELDVTVSDNSSQNGYDVTLVYDQQTIELSSGQLPQTFTLIGKGNQSLITTINNTGGPVSNQTASINVEVDSYITKKSIALNQDGLFTRNRDNEVVPLLSLIGGTGTSSSGGGGSTDYISDVSLSGNDISFTGTGDAFNGTVEGLAVTGSSNTFQGNLTATNFILSSDRRLKTDLVSITKGIEKISQLHPFEYTKNSVREIGIIAQDLEKVSPASVHENKDGYKVVDTMALSTINLAAIKELVEQFVYLEERVKKLEDKQ